MRITLNGRKALITGGSMGLGLAVAKKLIEAGGHVALVARRQTVLDEARESVAACGDGKVITVAADVATAQGCTRAFEEAKAKLGSVDILVNNAGTSQVAPFEEITDEVWQADLDLKLFAAIRLARLAMPDMRAAKWGRIINVLNTGAKAPVAGNAPTAVSRAAGLSLTKVLSFEGAADNVLVNALLVGRIESDQWVRRAEASGESLADFYKKMGSGLPMGRVGTADEFAAMACLLASEQGGYINGAAINVDGGLCAVT